MVKLKSKLTAVTINGRTMFLTLPVDENGKVRIKAGLIAKALGIPEGHCLVVG